jgi:hypothetical protein
MAEEVKITVLGDEIFRRKILAMRYRARNMSPVLHSIKDEWLGQIEEQFATEGLRGGRKWAPLARDTVLRRGSAHPILVRSGDLLINVTDPEHIHVSDHELKLELPPEIETVAASHQYGFFNARAGKEVPARPWMVITDLEDRGYRRKITDFLVNGRL